MDKLRLSGENFNQRSNSNTLRQSLNNFYFSSNKSETFSTLIQMLKSDLLTIQDMINSNNNDIKMYKLLSKNQNLNNKLSEIEENNNINFFVEKINEQSGNIEKISKIYGTQSATECIQKLFLESNLSDLFMKKISDYFILMKIKLYNDDSYQESLSKIISIREFIEKVPQGKNIEKKNLREKNESFKKEINDFLKIKTLNDLLDYNSKNKKLFLHIIKLVNDYLNNLNIKIIDIINKYDAEKKNLNLNNNFKGNQITKFNKIKDVYYNLLDDYKNKYEYLLDKEKNKPNIEEQINKISEKYENEINELNIKIEKILNENEDLKKNIISNSEYKYSMEDIEKLKKSCLEENNNYEEMNKKNLESLNNEINNLNEKILELKKKIEEKEIENNNKNLIINESNNNKIIKIEKVDIISFVKKHDIEYAKNKKESDKKLENIIKELSLKVNQLIEEINIIKVEKLDLKKKLDVMNNITFKPQIYEKILLEQFDKVKEAFNEKVEDLEYQLETIQNESRKKIYELEQNLKESENLKNIFMNQIISLQNQI